MPAGSRPAAGARPAACYARAVIRARAGRADSHPARLLILAIATVATLAACTGGESANPGTPGPGASSTASPVGSEDPTDLPSSSPGPGETGAASSAPQETGSPGTPAGACSGNDGNREFYLQAAVNMTWPVYCAVLPDGWFLESGSYRLADGGRLEATYRGPDDVYVGLVQGNVCNGADVEACAPRDAVIGPAAFGDQEGELGRLSNGLVLDVDRGANPSWRATGVGLSEEAFREIGAALLTVED